MRAWLGQRCRRIAGWLFELGDRIEGVEPVLTRMIELSPEAALKALEDAAAKQKELEND